MLDGPSVAAALKECGITHVVLATSYRAEMFTEAFGDGAQFGLTIDYVYESQPLGTGGGIRNAAELLRGGEDPGRRADLIRGLLRSSPDFCGLPVGCNPCSGAQWLHLCVVDIASIEIAGHYPWRGLDCRLNVTRSEPVDAALALVSGDGGELTKSMFAIKGGAGRVAPCHLEQFLGSLRGLDTRADHANACG